MCKRWSLTADLWVIVISSWHIHPALHSHTADNPQLCRPVLNDQIHSIPIIFSVQETATICYGFFSLFFYNRASTCAWLIYMYRFTHTEAGKASPITIFSQNLDIPHYLLGDVTVKLYNMSFTIILSPLCQLRSDKKLWAIFSLIPVWCLIFFFLIPHPQLYTPPSCLVLSCLFTELCSVTQYSHSVQS